MPTTPTRSIDSNPFCTRFIRPGSLPFAFEGIGQLDDCEQRDNDRSPCSLDRRIQQIVDRLTHVRFGLIVGPHGTGKSTLLQTLRPILAQRYSCIEQIQLHTAMSDHASDRWRQTRTNVKAATKTQSSVCSGGLLIVDGMEQLPIWHRWRLRRAAIAKQHAILATSHHRVKGFATLHGTLVDRKLVESLVERLLRHSPSDTCNMVRRRLQNIEICDSTNVRDLWFDLYDLVARFGAHGDDRTSGHG